MLALHYKYVLDLVYKKQINPESSDLKFDIKWHGCSQKEIEKFLENYVSEKLNNCFYSFTNYISNLDSNFYKKYIDYIPVNNLLTIKNNYEWLKYYNKSLNVYITNNLLLSDTEITSDILIELDTRGLLSYNINSYIFHTNYNLQILRNRFTPAIYMPKFLQFIVDNYNLICPKYNNNNSFYEIGNPAPICRHSTLTLFMFNETIKHLLNCANMYGINRSQEYNY